MPTYQFACKVCEDRFSASVDREARESVLCAACGGPSRQIMGGVNVFLKGDGWTGKSFLLRDQMEQKNKRLLDKQTEKAREAPEYRLVPNVQGEEVDSWREAAKYAKSKGLSPDAYQQMAEHEARQ